MKFAAFYGVAIRRTLMLLSWLKRKTTKKEVPKNRQEAIRAWKAARKELLEEKIQA
ncbi:hypothetical protein FOPG_15017 [Fusarium oxysporum f. sp. conglutinans race 2 54008]|uniref:Uncharacterized protein n=1 Tax=Fusarium oxysporum f. sp. conglutinans race 2 54008 TaxID=1089457 RepID=X0I6N8_FUSOX|nr:hypothetical protein FOPG_15017 [Fusarium oxysporum f. sp. conglutinans race 2 54008]